MPSGAIPFNIAFVPIVPLSNSSTLFSDHPFDGITLSYENDNCLVITEDTTLDDLQEVISASIYSAMKHTVDFTKSTISFKISGGIAAKTGKIKVATKNKKLVVDDEGLELLKAHLNRSKGNTTKVIGQLTVDENWSIEFYEGSERNVKDRKRREKAEKKAEEADKKKRVSDDREQQKKVKREEVERKKAEENAVYVLGKKELGTFSNDVRDQSNVTRLRTPITDLIQRNAKFGKPSPVPKPRKPTNAAVSVPIWKHKFPLVVFSVEDFYVSKEFDTLPPAFGYDEESKVLFLRKNFQSLALDEKQDWELRYDEAQQASSTVTRQARTERNSNQFAIPQSPQNPQTFGTTTTPTLTVSDQYYRHAPPIYTGSSRAHPVPAAVSTSVSSATSTSLSKKRPLSSLDFNSGQINTSLDGSADFDGGVRGTSRRRLEILEPKDVSLGGSLIPEATHDSSTAVPVSTTSSLSPSGLPSTSSLAFNQSRQSPTSTLKRKRPTTAASSSSSSPAHAVPQSRKPLAPSPHVPSPVTSDNSIRKQPYKSKEEVMEEMMKELGYTHEKWFYIDYISEGEYGQTVYKKKSGVRPGTPLYDRIPDWDKRKQAELEEKYPKEPWFQERLRSLNLE